MESAARKERRDSPDPVVPLEDGDDLETMGPKETQVQSASLVILVPLVKLDPEVKMAPKENEERTVKQENLVPQGLLERTDLLAL